MRLTSIVFLVILTASCSPSSDMKQSSTITEDDSMRIVYNYLQTKKNEDTKFKMEADSFREELLKMLDFPDLRKVDHEAFLFYWGKVHFAQPDYAFLLEEVSEKNYQLKTVAIFHLTPPQVHKIRWKGKEIDITETTVLERTIQKVPANEWMKYHNILEGSYYWAFENPCPEGDAILDGEGWGLESMSRRCGDFKLTYHRTSIHSPSSGSYRDAGLFLIKLSNLTSGLWQEKITRR